MQSKNRTRLFSDSGEEGRRGVATFRGRRHPPPCPRAAHSSSRREVSRRLRGKKAHRAFLPVACRCGMGTHGILTATEQGEKTRDAPYKKAPEMGAFLYGVFFNRTTCLSEHSDEFKFSIEHKRRFIR